MLHILDLVDVYTADKQKVKFLYNFLKNCRNSPELTESNDSLKVEMLDLHF